MSQVTDPQVAVLIVDDHQLLGQSLAMALGAEGVSASVADLRSRQALVEQVRAAPPPLVLLDLELGGAIGDGATLVRPFVEAGCRVLVVSGTDDVVRQGTALEQGAIGLVHKSEPFEELLAKALAAAHGQQVMSEYERQVLVRGARSARRNRAALHEPFDRLTPREQQVLRALAQGLSVGRIAKDWRIAETTVRAQVRAILSKLGVSSQLEAVALAFKAGWLTEAD